MVRNYLWTDNPTEANVALYDPDILNECLMHLKYQNEKLPKFCINSASVDANGNANLLSYAGNIVKFNCGNSIVPIMANNSQGGWSLAASHPIVSSSSDIYKSFDNNNMDYSSLQHTPSEESPAFIIIEKSTVYSFDYLYLKFKTTINQGDIKSFKILDEEDNTLYSYENFDDYLHKDEFLIPISNFKGKKLKLLATLNVNDATYVNFPSIIKLLDKTQVATLTNIKGEIGNLVNVNDLVIPSVANKTYTIFAGVDGSVEAFNTALSKSTLLPINPVTNQIHLLTCAEPLLAKKYNGTIWEEYNKVPVGYCKTNSNGAISEIVTFAYAQNGYDLNISSFTQNLSANGWAKLPNGLIFQWGVSPNLQAGGILSITFPIAFPVSFLIGQSQPTVFSGLPEANCVTYGGNSTSMSLRSGSSITQQFMWYAIGY